MAVVHIHRPKCARFCELVDFRISAALHPKFYPDERRTKFTTLRSQDQTGSLVPRPNLDLDLKSYLALLDILPS